jgi:hypothetical protein
VQGDRLNAPLNELIEKEDPLAALVHRDMDRRREKLRKELDRWRYRAQG